MNEVKKMFTNVFFWTGLILLTIFIFASGVPYMKTLLRAEYSAEGVSWTETFRYCTINENGLLFVPICVPMAAGAYAETELRSRYALFSCSRIGKRSYYVKKIIECALPGGLMVCFSEVLVLFIVYIGLQGIPTQIEGNGVGAAAMILLTLLRGFLNGAFWGLAGSTAAVLTRNQYLAYAMPFVMYYVLTLFQSRFYRELYFLSPRYWAAPVHYGNIFCIAVLSGLAAVCAVCLALAVKRRLDHA
ncbi:ABC transporter permease [Mediterraneibacter agrestimuris]|uniref:ABC transporter permease n=1 Tax=Mediterraneibacter agrestimuris TaxID=2941333 RepID=UPI002041F5B8|nr:ABC transporter permease [Mediterraneibacter agrestimuris]